MKLFYKILFLFISIVGVNSYKAQTYGNEWINYSTQYFKFPITKTGLFRISATTLASAGIPANTATSAMRVYGRQKELPVYVFDGGDGTIETGDYLEFYAEKNDGWLDSSLYNSPSDIGNPSYSLYNDTIFYFFSIDASTPALRFIEETDIDFAAYTPADYVWDIAKANYRDFYSEGAKNSKVSSSFYLPGEGWASSALQGVPGGYNLNVSLPTINLYTGFNAPSSIFHGKSVSENYPVASNGSEVGLHHTKWRIGSSALLLQDSIYIGYKQSIVNSILPNGTLQDGATNLQWSIIDDQSVITDLQSFQYAQITYPRTTSFAGSQDGYWLIPKATTASKSLLNLSNMANEEYHAFTLGEVKRKLKLVWDGANFQTLVPNTTELNQDIYIQRQTYIEEIAPMQLINSTGLFTNFAALPIESALLVVYPKLLETSVATYAAYRNSNIGGNHNVVLAEVDELYLQYAAGIPKHVLGIRNFALDMHSNSINKPVGLFLFGKGVREVTESALALGAGSRRNASSYQKNLVPSFGYPSSDVAITAQTIPGSPWEPLIPTGRLSVSSTTTADIYVTKLIAYENQQNQSSTYSIPTKEWQKQILHFGGGSNASEQDQFRGHLEGMENIIEGSSFAGNVTSFFKTVSDPINPTQLTNVNSLLQKGVSIMNFFGHATGDGFDQNIDEPINWNNQDKYPFVIGNSCYTGDIYSPGANSSSERFLLIPNEGAIGFISSVKYGYAPYLNTYTSNLYQQISSTNYGKPIAYQIKSNIASIYDTPTNVFLESACLQMAYHGDPVMKVNWHRKPEIDITIENTYVEPENITLETDSIKLNIIITNLGRSIDSLISVEIIRDFPLSNIDSVYSFSLPGLNFKDTIQLKIPMQPNIAVGLNEFKISIDLPSTVVEQYDEIGNNQITKNLFINIDGILPVEPYEYAVVPKNLVTVKASTINPIAPLRTYLFELDTTDLFNSPQHRSFKITALGGVKEVAPNQWNQFGTNTNFPLVCEDSMVYFWRVAVDSITPNWIESSFQYIENKTGWGQDHFFQFKNNSFSSLGYNRTLRKREFAPLSVQLTAKNIDNPSGFQYYQSDYKIGGLEQDYGVCTTIPSLHVAVIDPVTLESWGNKFTSSGGVVNNPTHNFGNANDEGGCRPRVEKYFNFRQTNASQLANFQAMMAAIPNGYYILVYSDITGRFDQWDALQPSMYATFASLGSTELIAPQPNRSFIFFTKKGDPSTVVEAHSTVFNETITITANLVGSLTSGTETSTIVGPASKWETIYYKQNSIESPTNDSTILRIQALDINKNPMTSIDYVFAPNDSIIDVNTIFSASVFPYLRLSSILSDTFTFTPAQNNRWHVLYSPLPEAAIDGTNGYTWLPSKDSLVEGEEVKFAADIKNIYTLDMDSLLVNYWVEDKDRVKHPIAYSRQDSLKVGETFRDTIQFSTVGFSGVNSLWMEVNPYVNGSTIITDQPEQKHFNNLLEKPFFVKRDEINPILDVTFNGQRILNGDIVAPESEIVISLKDENQYLIMDQDTDTSLFGIYLTDPNGVQRRIPFIGADGAQVMQWIPANANNKRFKIIHPASFTLDGKYSLQVQGTDKSGNLSGKFDYKIEFEVIHESSITYLMNYPNPFSTSTRFVFTVTGNEVPQEMLIQIMTITGKVVREITEDELGTIQIGRNISEYAWDGKDSYGDFLANGVYLYRVIAKINGEDIKHRDSGADSHFKKDFGKMYIIR
jgi:hypothetical protein